MTVLRSLPGSKHLAVPLNSPPRWNLSFFSRSPTLVRSMAADWQPECLVPPQNQPSLDTVGAHSDRALQNTSGNVQSYADTLTHGDAAGREEHLQQLAFKYPHAPAAPHHVAAPSLQHQQAVAARLQARKLRRLHSVGPNAAPRRGRSYLKSQKYLEYRARPRRDTGKDGEPSGLMSWKMLFSRVSH